ncbi:MAG TPA: nuclear transport factor 2 family protein [Candidatus Methylomirabilis sp.]|nr:nuclear transport factor 2 family protein [Candidatus Methylomirabilis sp.]
MKQHTLHVVTSDEEHGAEMQRQMRGCVQAFNDSDEKAFGDCLDPKISLFTPDAHLFGREQVAGYFRQKYFHQTPAARLEIHESSFHLIGQTVWYEYEFTIESRRGRLHGRGMAMCQETAGRWRMASMHHSLVEFEQGTARSADR